MDRNDNNDELRRKIIGLGSNSFQKSYYPQLKKRLSELERFRSVLNESNDAIYVFESSTLQLIEVNKNGARFIGFEQEDMVGKNLSQLFGDGVANKIEMRSAVGNSVPFVVNLRRRAENGLSEVEVTVKDVTFEKRAYLVLVARDIRERLEMEKKLRASLQEKGSLLQEVHHRVKNNLQVISSLLDLQMQYNEDVDPFEVLQKARNRVRAMALIHESLYASEKLTSARFYTYVMNLVEDVKSFYRLQSVQSDIHFGRFMLGVDQAVPCALVINELIGYYFKGIQSQRGKNKKTVSISFTKKGNMFLLEFVSNVKFKNGEQHLSLELAHILAEQLGGVLQINSQAGLKISVSFPAKVASI